MATLTNMRTSVRQRLGVPSTDSFYTDTILTGLINEALNWYAGQWDWPWLEKSETISCADADSDYSLASDYQSTIAVIDSTGTPLVEKPFDELLFMTDAKSANPHFYTVYNATLHVRPVPNGSFNLTHYYRAAETALSGDSDTPAMPDQWLGAVYEYAAGLGFQAAGNLTDAGEKFKTANAWIDQMRTRANRDSASLGGGQRPPGQEAAE